MASRLQLYPIKRAVAYNVGKFIHHALSGVYNKVRLLWRHFLAIINVSGPRARLQDALQPCTPLNVSNSRLISKWFEEFP